MAAARWCVLLTAAALQTSWAFRARVQNRDAGQEDETPLAEPEKVDAEWCKDFPLTEGCFSFLNKKSYSPQADVDKAWAKVHETLPDPKARVDYEHFYEAVKHLNRDDEKHDAFDKFAKQVFRTGTAFMASDWQDWNDLGKHCFSYAYLMANEFYDDKPRDNLGLTLKAAERPQDQAEAIRKECDEAWEAVQKDGDGRVTWEAFKLFFMNKYWHKLNSESKPQYEKFLKQLFTTNLAMMLPAKKDTLGGHCFRYGALMAGEFYFDAAKGAGGCGTPVTDVLGLTK